MMTKKRPTSPLARTTQLIKNGAAEIGGKVFHVEDWWENVHGGSWMDASGNPAALHYAVRSGTSRIPLDNEVLYGKIGGFGYLVHVSEIAPSEEKR